MLGLELPARLLLLARYHFPIRRCSREGWRVVRIRRNIKRRL